MYDLDMGKAIIVLMFIAGIVGWAVIEILLWLFSFINITFG